MTKSDYMSDPKIICLIRLAEEVADSTYAVEQKRSLLTMLEKTGITFILDQPDGLTYGEYSEIMDEFIITSMLKRK